MANEKVIHLNADSFAAEIQGGVVLVDFWAPWCGPCRLIAETIDELADEYDGRAKICKLNVDDEGALAMQFGVMSIPTLILFQAGQPVERLVGLRSKEALTEALDKLLSGK